MTRRAAVALLALLSVAPVLAWSFGLGSFRAWFLATTVPSAAGLVAIAAVAADLRPYLRRGVLGGLLGTLGYDAFRVPFVVGGKRLFAPIDSYGILALGARHSSPLTGFTGWTYHLANGVCFGVAYALVMDGRNRWYGVGWGLVLETATVVTPFATLYGLRGQWGLIGIAYAAHVAYGLPLGYVVERRLEWPAIRTLAITVAALAIWLHPWQPSPDRVLVGTDGRWHPEWIRVRQGDCLTTPIQRCFPTVGVQRVKTTDAPYSGGFVIVERRPR